MLTTPHPKCPLDGESALQLINPASVNDEDDARTTGGGGGRSLIPCRRIHTGQEADGCSPEAGRWPGGRERAVRRWHAVTTAMLKQGLDCRLTTMIFSCSGVLRLEFCKWGGGAKGMGLNRLGIHITTIDLPAMSIKILKYRIVQGISLCRFRAKAAMVDAVSPPERRLYLCQQGGDDVQGGLLDGLVLQRRGEGHVHQRPDLLQHHVPAARVLQNLPVFVDLLLRLREMTEAGKSGGNARVQRDERRTSERPKQTATQNQNVRLTQTETS